MEKTTKKTTLTGKEWWLHLMYWDPDKVDQANLCYAWRMPFIFIAKGIYYALMLFVALALFYIGGVVTLWAVPDLKSNCGYKSLPFARIFGVRWGNFLPLVYVFAVYSIISTMLNDKLPGVERLAAANLAPTVFFLAFLGLSSLVIALVSVLFLSPNKEFKTFQMSSSKGSGEEFGLFKVLKLRLKSLREKVCYSIPIVRD